MSKVICHRVTNPVFMLSVGHFINFKIKQFCTILFTNKDITVERYTINFPMVF